MMSGDIFGDHNWGKECFPVGVEAGDAANHPTMHKIVPTRGNDLTPNVNSGTIENHGIH